MANISYLADRLRNATTNTSYELLPAGEYVVEIIDSELRENSAKTGNLLRLTMNVLEPIAHAGRKLWENINVDHPNATTQEIGERTLNTIKELCGIPAHVDLVDSEELHYKPIPVTVAVERRKDNGVLANRPRFSKKEGGAATSAAAPRAAAPRPAAAPAAAARPASAVSRPWDRQASA